MIRVSVKKKSISVKYIFYTLLILESTQFLYRMSKICTENYSLILSIKTLIMYRFRKFEDLWRPITNQSSILIPIEKTTKTLEKIV